MAIQLNSVKFEDGRFIRVLTRGRGIIARETLARWRTLLGGPDPTENVARRNDLRRHTTLIRDCVYCTAVFGGQRLRAFTSAAEVKHRYAIEGKVTICDSKPTLKRAELRVNTITGSEPLLRHLRLLSIVGVILGALTAGRRTTAVDRRPLALITLVATADKRRHGCAASEALMAKLQLTPRRTVR